jgi:hypothetical protein
VSIKTNISNQRNRLSTGQNVQILTSETCNARGKPTINKLHKVVLSLGGNRGIVEKAVTAKKLGEGYTEDRELQLS